MANQSQAMDTKRGGFEEPRFLDFPHLPDGASRDGAPALNKYSSTITKDHDFPGAQVCPCIAVSLCYLTNPPKAMLYAAGVPDKKTMKTAPHVGIASVWWEGNPCNMHLLDLGKEVKKAVEKGGMLGWQYNTIGVSDGITMGGQGMHSSREH